MIAEQGTLIEMVTLLATPMVYSYSLWVLTLHIAK